MPTELLQDHTGTMHLYSDGRPVAGSSVIGVTADQRTGELQAHIVVPLKHAVLGEVRNVVPFVRPEAA